ncbi:MAG: prepilin-type N-terminal cleavage/methylation domain-containing protein [Candidatus Hydrogenedentota bacterium]
MAAHVESGSTPSNPPFKGDLAAGMSRPAPARRLAGGSGQAGRAGFTLIELLVAVAIMSTVMAGVTALFLGSLQTVQRGRSTIGGYELARTTLETVERDLSTAFTSRDWGDYYTFYGTPIGFTYLGVAEGRTDNLQRVSYAVFVGHMTAEDYQAGQWGTDRFFIEEEVFDADLDEFVDEEREVATYTLVRYVEPEVGNLDNFMVTLPEVDENGRPQRKPLDMLDEDDAPALPEGIDADYASQVQQLQQELAAVDTRVRALTTPADLPLDEVLTETEIQRVIERFEHAKKRELWIRMLSGDPRLPRFWANPFNFTDPRPRMRDYAIAENLVMTPDPDYVNGDGPLIPILPDADGIPAAFQGIPYFEYGRFEHRAEEGVQTLPYWLDWQNAVEQERDADGELVSEEFAPVLFAGSPFRPRIPEMVALRLPFVIESPHPTAPHFERVFENEVRIPTGHTRRPSVDREVTAGAGGEE